MSKSHPLPHQPTQGSRAPKTISLYADDSDEGQMANHVLCASKPLTIILSDDEDSEPHKHTFSKGKPFTNDVINILSSSDLSMQDHPSAGSKCKQPAKEPTYSMKKLKTGKSAGKMAANWCGSAGTCSHLIPYVDIGCHSHMTNQNLACSLLPCRIHLGFPANSQLLPDSLTDPRLLHQGDGKKRNTGLGRSRYILTDTVSEGEGEIIKHPCPKPKLTRLKAKHTQGASTSPPTPPPASDAHKAPKDHPHHWCLPSPLPEPSAACQSSPTDVGAAHQQDQALSGLTPPQEDLTSQAPAHINPTSTSMQPQPIPPPLPNAHPVGPGIYPPPP